MTELTSTEELLHTLLTCYQKEVTLWICSSPNRKETQLRSHRVSQSKFAALKKQKKKNKSKKWKIYTMKREVGSDSVIHYRIFEASVGDCCLGWEPERLFLSSSFLKKLNSISAFVVYAICCCNLVTCNPIQKHKQSLNCFVLSLVNYWFLWSPVDEMGFPAGIVIAGAILMMSAAVVLCSFPSTLVLERAFPADHRVPLSQLRARDRVRHGRMLQSSNGVADFPVEGTFDPFRVG